MITGCIRFIAALLFIVCCQLMAASSVLVWPVYPVIEADQNGTPLWLENRGSTPVTLQIRVMSWKQQNYQDRYADQDDVVASPPFATIKPGERQLVRLVRITSVPEGHEEAFRIIIDELPQASSSSVNRQSGLEFRMRYLLPLFIYGQNVWTKPRSDLIRDQSTAARPQLSWRIIDGALVVRNSGHVHARLSNVFWGDNAHGNIPALTLSSGLLGYVLAGQEMKWPLPAGKQFPVNRKLFAQLADNTAPVALSPAR